MISLAMGLGVTSLAGVGVAEEVPISPAELSEAPIAAVLQAASPEVRRYNDHITTLANPFFQGRVPGSQGSEVAKRYMEFWFEQFDLQPAFTGSGGEPTFLQPFAIGGSIDVVSQSIEATSGADRTKAFEAGVDFTATGLGGEGEAVGEPVFVGYSIEDGPDGYTNFAEDADLTGKIAIMLRFEPMNDDGWSAWSESGRWTGAASFSNKIANVAARGAEAAIIINPPGTNDPRAQRLVSPRMGGGGEWDLPVFHMTTEAGDVLVQMLSDDDRSLTEWRERADEAATATMAPLSGRIAINADLEMTTLTAENVGALLPGKGELADEIIVVGAHFDHTGDGGFGTPTSLEQTHNGADDNASGTAGVLLLAEFMAGHYAAMPEDADARSILFIGFDAEESGLNGAYHYVREPIRALDDHYLMVNFDMIGRVVDGGLSVFGTRSAEGMQEWLTPKFEASGLNIVEPATISRRSDHAPFYFEGEMPILFAIINPLHSDYHTANDHSWKINRTDAVRVVRLFEDIVLDAATRSEALVYAAPTAQQQPRMPRVFFGVVPRQAGEGAEGIIFAQVTEGSSAAEAGVQAGDILVEWDGEPVDTLDEWRLALLEHAPGDTISFVVMRGEERVELETTLQGR